MTVDELKSSPAVFSDTEGGPRGSVAPQPQSHRTCRIGLGVRSKLPLVVCVIGCVFICDGLENSPGLNSALERKR